MDAYKDYIAKRRRQELREFLKELFWIHFRMVAFVGVIIFFVLFVVPLLP